MRDQHGNYFAGLLQQLEADLKGRRQLAALDEIQADFENVRTAWLWALRQKNYAAINEMLDSLSLFCEMRGRFAEGMELCWQAQIHVAADPSDVLLVMWGRLFTHWAQLYLLRLEFLVDGEALQAQLEKSLAQAQKHGEQEDIAFCWWMLGLISLWTQNPAAAIPQLEKSLALYREREDHYSIAKIADYLADSYVESGQSEKFGPMFSESLRLQRQIGDQFGLAVTLNSSAVMAFEQGHFEEAEHAWREIGTIYERMGNRAWLARNNLFMAALAWFRGNFDDIEMLDTAALDILPRGGKSLKLALSGMSANIKEDYVQGRQLCETVVDGSAFGRIGLAVAAYGLGDYQQARQHLRSWLGLRMPANQPTTILLGLPFAAVLLAHDGDLEHAAEVLGLSFQHPASAVGWLQKWLLLTRLRTRLEIELGSEVFSAAWKRGKTLDLVAVIEEQRMESAHARPTTRSPFSTKAQELLDPLTEREFEVLRLLIVGRSNREIAETLVLAVGTVKWYVSEIYNKLGVSSRTQAIARAGELKLLS